MGIKSIYWALVGLILLPLFIAGYATAPAPKEKAWKTVSPPLDFPPPEEKIQARIGIYYEPDSELSDTTAPTKPGNVFAKAQPVTTTILRG